MCHGILLQMETVKQNNKDCSLTSAKALPYAHTFALHRATTGDHYNPRMQKHLVRPL